MKCVIKKTCDIGKILAEYYEAESQEMLNCGIEVAITFPLEYCFQNKKAENKESASLIKKTDSGLIEILKVAASKMIDELWLATESSS